MKVKKVVKVNSQLVSGIQKLMPELSCKIPPPDKKDLEEIVQNPMTELFIAENDIGEVIGTLTLVIIKIPSGVKSRIEDVVVSSKARRLGIGHSLIEAAIDFARELNIPYIDLTSHPNRVAANKLYQKIGFRQGQTNVYRRYSD